MSNATRVFQSWNSATFCIGEWAAVVLWRMFHRNQNNLTSDDDVPLKENRGERE